MYLESDSNYDSAKDVSNELSREAEVSQAMLIIIKLMISTNLLFLHVHQSLSGLITFRDMDKFSLWQHIITERGEYGLVEYPSHRDY